MFSSPRQFVLLAASAIIIYLTYQILQPFLVSIFLALILATLTAPVYQFFLVRLRGRRNIAALLVCLGLTVAIALPLSLLVLAMTREANEVYNRLRRPEVYEGLRHWIEFELQPLVLRLQDWVPIQDIDAATIQERVQQVALAALGAITALLTGIFTFLLNYVIMLVVLFFMLRDSASLESSLRQLSPLAQKDEQIFVEKFRAVTYASVVGNGLTAIAQGAAMGLLFLALGIPNALLWGAIGALLSLLPMIGMAFVWLPWAIYLFLAGEVLRGVILVVVQNAIVGSLDNVLRPLLIESRVKMHTLLIFFSILGGIQYFGMLGILFGPLIFALALTLLEFYMRPSSGEEESPQSAD